MEKEILLAYSMPFPSIGLWDAMQQNNIKQMVLDEHIRFEKMSYRNRYYVCGAQGIHLLTIPVAQGRNQRIAMKDVLIDNNTPWQKNHWKTLTTHYMRAPFFEYMAPVLEPLFVEKFDRLVDFNRATVKCLQSLLQLKIDIQYQLNITTENEATIWDLRRSLRPLQAIPETKNRNYHQVFMDRCGFIPELSILDYIFNEGVHL